MCPSVYIIIQNRQLGAFLQSGHQKTGSAIYQRVYLRLHVCSFKHIHILKKNVKTIKGTNEGSSRVPYRIQCTDASPDDISAGGTCPGSLRLEALCPSKTNVWVDICLDKNLLLHCPMIGSRGQKPLSRGQSPEGITQQCRGGSLRSWPLGHLTGVPSQRASPNMQGLVVKIFLVSVGIFYNEINVLIIRPDYFNIHFCLVDQQVKSIHL